ncbi:MAG: hypothetical protein GY812_13650 [Actinomycetia bacterium]|nr:hypothetical protein [Actinomycetes bacterium]
MSNSSNTTTRNPRRALIGLALALALPLAGLGCSVGSDQQVDASAAGDGAPAAAQEAAAAAPGDEVPDPGLCELLLEASSVDFHDPGGSIDTLKRLEASAPDLVAREVEVVRRAYEKLAADPSADYSESFGADEMSAAMTIVAWESEMCEDNVVELSLDDLDAAEEAAGDAPWVDAVAATSIINGRASISMWPDATAEDATAACQTITSQVPGAVVDIHVGEQRAVRSVGQGCEG